MTAPEPCLLDGVVEPLAAFSWLAQALADPRNDVSFGAFGAFGQLPKSERTQMNLDDERIVVATESATIDVRRQAGFRLVPFETLSSDPRSWNQAVALCLPEVVARMPMRQCFTDIGPDFGAIETPDKCIHHFDIGLGLAYAAVLVRERQASGRTCASYLGAQVTADEALVFFEGETWIFQTGLGRLEVRDARRRYVISNLLSSGATHVVDAPIPHGLVPVGYVFPPNPAHIARCGAGTTAAREARMHHDRFQSLLARYGPPDLVQLKHRVKNALAHGLAPEDTLATHVETNNLNRWQTNCIRVALRQYRWHYGKSGGRAWETLFDKPLSRAPF